MPLNKKTETKMLYRGKEKIELIIYLLKWYSPTSFISLTLLVLLLTDVLQSYLSLLLLLLLRA